MQLPKATAAIHRQFNTSQSTCSNMLRVWIGSEKMIGEYEMPLVTVVITLGVVGLLLWLVNRYIPMQSQIKGILNGVVVIAVILWLLNIFGLFEYISQFRIGH
jgi:hypothetical protein